VQSIWPLRSMLFIPAHKLDWVRKVKRFDPDAVVLDLEDAVPAGSKGEARQLAREGIRVLQDLGIAAFVRVNALEQGGDEDVPAVVIDGLSGVMLPKGRSVEEVRELDGLLAHAEGKADLPYRSVSVLPLPETAEGMWSARDLAAASKRVKGLVGVIAGPVAGDVARAMGFTPTLEGSEQLYLASKMVLDSRAGGGKYPLASIIGTKLDDLDAVRRLIQRAKAFGYAGVIVIHPSHVQIANEVYTPTVEEVRYFAGLIQAMEQAERRGDAAVSYEGAMIDYAMLPTAQEIIREAHRRGVVVS
jgi:citrate lyase subunit beta / citryl-CoA lyase